MLPCFCHISFPIPEWVKAYWPISRYCCAIALMLSTDAAPTVITLNMLTKVCRKAKIYRHRKIAKKKSSRSIQFLISLHAQCPSYLTQIYFYLSLEQIWRNLDLSVIAFWGEKILTLKKIKVTSRSRSPWKVPKTVLWGLRFGIFDMKIALVFLRLYPTKHIPALQLQWPNLYVCYL